MQKKRTFVDYLPIVLGALILLAVAAIAAEEHLTLFSRGTDRPPTIEFTWMPIGRVSLFEMKGHLRMVDDYALDFTTYRMTIKEIDKTIDLPIDGLVGREYEQDISLSYLANDAVLNSRKTVTIEFTIADDKGQKTTLVKEIKLK